MAYVAMRRRAPIPFSTRDGRRKQAKVRCSAPGQQVAGAAFPGAGIGLGKWPFQQDIAKRPEYCQLIDPPDRLGLQGAAAFGPNMSSPTRSVGLASPPIRRMASVSHPSRPSYSQTSVSDTVLALSIEGVLAPGVADK